MQYCTIEEAWGPTFKKKKSKKEKRLEKQEQKMLDGSIDPDIVIPKMADARQTYQRQTQENTDTFNGYDQYSSRFGSPYSSKSKSVEVTNTDILENNKRLEQQYNNPQQLQQSQQPQQSQQSQQPQLETQLGETAIQELQKMIQIKQDDYIKLKEGFTNQTDDQFNQLLLFIFTGIFYLFMLDMMYQLGKKSY